MTIQSSTLRDDDPDGADGVDIDKFTWDEGEIEILPSSSDASSSVSSEEE